MGTRYKDMLEYIKATDNKCSEGIFYAVELLKSSLYETKERIKREANIATNDENIKQTRCNLDYIELINEIDKELTTIRDILALENEEGENEKSVDELIEKVVERIDYSKYDVNRFEKHSLDEDFEYRRPYALEISSWTIEEGSWKGLLVKLCEFLYKKDKDILCSFIGSPKYEGRKLKYFSMESVRSKNVRIPSSDIYVWTNQSANSTVRLMKKILIDYGIDLNTVYVYLTRDLSSMHR